MTIYRETLKFVLILRYRKLTIFQNL